MDFRIVKRMICEVRRDLRGQMIVDSLHLKLRLESYFRSELHVLGTGPQIPGADLSNVQRLCVINTVKIFSSLNSQI